MVGATPFFSMRNLAFGLFCIWAFQAWGQSPSTTRLSLGAPGIPAREVVVWNPRPTATRPMPSLWLMDGQNVFDTCRSFGVMKPGWKADSTLLALMREGRFPPCLLVAVSSGSERVLEYAPSQAQDLLPDSLQRKWEQEFAGKPRGDAFVNYLIDVVKPAVESICPLSNHPDSTWIGGSSRGAIISLYTVCLHPEVFGGALCLSTHWPLSRKNFFIEYGMGMESFLKRQLPNLGGHRLYFDHGNTELDAHYAPFQERINALLAGQNRTAAWVFKPYPNTGHHEKFWSQRLGQALQDFIQLKQ